MHEENQKKAKGHLDFAYMALSMADDVHSEMQQLKLKGDRVVRLWMDIHMTEEKYQACQEMAFNRLVRQGLIM